MKLNLSFEEIKDEELVLVKIKPIRDQFGKIINRITLLQPIDYEEQINTLEEKFKNDTNKLSRELENYYKSYSYYYYNFKLIDNFEIPIIFVRGR